jgi:hypothetical protein
MDKSQGGQSLTRDGVESKALGIDVDAVMANVRRGVQHYREDGLNQVDYLSEFDDLTCPKEPLSDKHNPLLYFHLRQVNQPFTWLRIELDLSRSCLDAVPLAGFLWNTLRRHLHSLSIFYVAKVAQPLTVHCREVVNILNILVHQDQQREAELNELKQQVAVLEARLARLEEKT